MEIMNTGWCPGFHTRKIQNFCKSIFCNFCESCLWPPSSPDLNPLDCFIWWLLDHATNRTSDSNVDFLKETITQKWLKLSPEYLTCASFRRRVKAVIEKEGNHIE